MLIYNNCRNQLAATHIIGGVLVFAHVLGKELLLRGSWALMPATNPSACEPHLVTGPDGNPPDCEDWLINSDLQSHE